MTGKDQLRNLIGDFVRYGQIETTLAKGKKIRGVVDRLVGWAKRGDLASRRRIAQKLGEKKLSLKLVDEIAPQLASRSSGFTRLVRLGRRKGDAAPRVRMEFVEILVAKEKEVLEPPKETIESKKMVKRKK